MSMPAQTPKRTVAVLGASGFLGSSLARYLAEQGHQVRACLRDKKQVSRLNGSNVEIHLGNNHEHGFLRKALAGCDAVFEFSSSTKPLTNFANPGVEHNLTVLPLIDIIEIAVESGVKKVIYPSSGGTVYGECQEPVEETAPLSPQTPYALCKIYCEQKLKDSVKAKRIAADVFRIGNPYGPGQLAVRGAGVIAHWAKALAEETQPIVIGDDTYRRDYVYIDDLCFLLTTALNDLEKSATWNLGSGNSVSILELFDVFQKAAGKEIEADFRDSRLTDNTSVLLNCDKLLSRFPDHQLVELEEGIRRTIDWHRNHAES